MGGPWSTTRSVSSTHRVLGGGAGWHLGASGGDVHHQCHQAAAAAGTRAAPHLHHQDKGVGLGSVIGEVDEGVPFQPKAPVFITWTRGSAQCHTTARAGSRRGLAVPHLQQWCKSARCCQGCCGTAGG